MSKILKTATVYLHYAHNMMNFTLKSSSRHSGTKCDNTGSHSIYYNLC